MCEAERDSDQREYDEFLPEVAFVRMVRRGLDDSDAGHVLSDNDMKRRIESWRD